MGPHEILGNNPRTPPLTQTGVEKLVLIHHFHIDHNALCLLPKILHTIVFDFSWDDCNTQEKLETIVLQNFGG